MKAVEWSGVQGDNNVNGPKSGGLTSPFDLRVRRRQLIGSTVILELAPPGGAMLPPFTAGAHIDLHLDDNLIRQYSLCNDPDDGDHYLLAVLLEPESRGGSAKVHCDLREGSTVKVAGPRNNFALNEKATHSILLGGGIGITPVLTMAWRLHRLGASFELHYCARTRASAAFIDHLTQTPFADRISIHLDDGDIAQRFDAAAVLTGPKPGVHVYVCGPTGFMDYVVNQATAGGWPDEQVHLERFSSKIDATGTAFTVHAARSGVEVEVAEGQTIAAALKEAGINVPISCSQGVCGMCLTRVLEGTPDHRDSYLLDDERAANNLILPCCSRSKTPALTLDI